VIPPLDTIQRIVVMALERGQLADLLFGDQTLASDRLIGATLGAIMKLSPVNGLDPEDEEEMKVKP
jgi:hypothetical protein